ncbi:transcriptional regulator [Burkholderia pseudomallei Pakistan 9]|nr:transcriptional regulator [Burkholderia pseudomallei Pakistan 9]
MRSRRPNATKPTMLLQIGNEIPTNDPKPSAKKRSSEIITASPFDVTNASPRTTSIVASVTISELIRQRAISTPLTNPTAPPANTPAAATSSTPCVAVISVEATTPENAAIGAITSPGLRRRPPAVAAVKGAHANVRISVEIDTSNVLLERLARDKLDVVVSRLPAEHDKLRALRAAHGRAGGGRRARRASAPRARAARAGRRAARRMGRAARGQRAVPSRRADVPAREPHAARERRRDRRAAVRHARARAQRHDRGARRGHRALLRDARHRRDAAARDGRPDGRFRNHHAHGRGVRARGGRDDRGDSRCRAGDLHSGGLTAPARDDSRSGLVESR